MIGWIDAGAGASGDMLLGALIDAGADEAAMTQAVAAVAPEPVTLTSHRVRRSGLVAVHARVDVTPSSTHRGLADVLAVIAAAELEPDVARHAAEVFTALGEAEAAVHGVSTSEVHFHEVGALDAIADIVGVCAGMVSLRLDRLHCGPVAVGSGTVETQHGELSVPPPAVAALLTGVPTLAGPAASELCTPTGAALLCHWVTAWGPLPPMTIERVGSGAGSRDFASHPNILRLFLGAPVDGFASPQAGVAVVLETNVDDLDPRLWPAVLASVLEAGASDAWLTPIVMKKGRPAHTLSVLVPNEHEERVQEVVFGQTSAIGMRRAVTGKLALARELTSVTIDGQRIAVKLARHGGAVVNVQPEYDDVAAAAAALGRPMKAVLAEAISQASTFWTE
ncbi:MAG: pyridinium-3,5-bisthiocarboxylic acid mononucleotide nickel chelatase [Nocardioidaceae bacterium]|nr:pyridinium-3,5-bisthiocarboxylic acid mononucleotide nickel chelatase [Nocardioidaceae bacterium]